MGVFRLSRLLGDATVDDRGCTAYAGTIGVSPVVHFARITSLSILRLVVEEREEHNLSSRLYEMGIGVPLASLTTTISHGTVSPLSLKMMWVWSRGSVWMRRFSMKERPRMTGK